MVNMCMHALFCLTYTPPRTVTEENPRPMT